MVELHFILFPFRALYRFNLLCKPSQPSLTLRSHPNPHLRVLLNLPHPPPFSHHLHPSSYPFLGGPLFPHYGPYPAHPLLPPLSPAQTPAHPPCRVSRLLRENLHQPLAHFATPPHSAHP